MSKKSKIKVGIITAPERTSDIAVKIIKQLANQFSKQIDDGIEWEVEQLVDPLTGAAETAQDILYNAAHIKRNKEWHYAICLTDLPIFQNKDIVAADISFNYRVAQISIPAFGWVSLERRIEKTIIHLLSELHDNDTGAHPKYYNSKTSEKQQDKSITHILKSHFPIMPIRRQENPDIVFKSDLDYVNNELHEKKNNDSKRNKQNPNEHQKDAEKNENSNEANDNNIDVRFLVFPRLRGRLKLILGMTFANNPMKIMSSFKNVIAIAFTTGAFSLIFPTIWSLGQIFSVYRLSAMMFATIFGLVAWIIVAHNLWEHPSRRNRPNIRRLYNLVTTSTLIIDVVAYYVAMFTLFLIACLTFMPVEYFQSMIGDYSGGSTLVNYMRVAWATASISTVVSAIGAGLENEELVRNITYGYRQIHRYEEVNRNKTS